MTSDELEAYLAALGFTVERASDNDERPYTVVCDVEISAGGLRGRCCDVAVMRVDTNPYVLPPAIHTRPPLVRMDSSAPLATQASPLGPDWQYWSRRLDVAPSPKRIWAHVLTILCNPDWEPV